MESSFRGLTSTLLSFFLISLLLSMSAMELASGMLTLLMLYHAYNWREQMASHKLFNPSGFDWIFPVWFLVACAGFIFVAEAGAPWNEALGEFRWIILLYVLIAAFRFLRPNEDVITPLTAVIGLVCVYSLVVYFVGVDPFRTMLKDGIPEPVGDRLGGFFNNPMTFAHVFQLVFCLCLGIGLYLIKWNDRRLKLALPVGILMGVCLLLTFTRGVWFSAGVTILIMGFLFNRKFGVMAVLILGLLYGVLYKTWPSFQERADHVTHWRENYDSERLVLWETNIKIFKESPLIGIGYGENHRLLRKYYEKYGVPSGQFEGHAHNQYLQFLAGTGALGLLCYLIVLFGFLRLSFKTFWQISERDFWEKGLSLGTIGAQIAFMLGGLSEANFEHMKVKYTMCAIWAVVVWLAYEYRVLRD